MSKIQDMNSKDLKKGVNKSEEVVLHFRSGKKTKKIKFKNPKEEKAFKMIKLYVLQNMIDRVTSKYSGCDILTKDYVLKSVEVDGTKFSAKDIARVIFTDKDMKLLK